MQQEAAIGLEAIYQRIGTGPVSAEALTSPEIYEQERTQVFGRMWLKVGRVEEIPNPGDYKIKRLDVANTAAILSRGKDGVVRAFHNICPHRGNKILPETGNETFGRARGHSLTCRFHGWVFDSSGPLRMLPREDRFPEKMDHNCFGMRAIHCDIWEGFIFINLADTPEQSLADYLGGIGRHFAGFPYGEATYARRYSTVLDCNWKIALYAFSEGYHVETIHAATFPKLAVLVHTEFKTFGPHSSSAIYVPPGGAGPTPATAKFGEVLFRSETHGRRLQDLPPTVNTERRNDFQFEFPVFFPNLVLHACAGSGYPGMVYFSHQFWPLGPDKTLWEGTNFYRQPTTPSELVAINHTDALHRNAWLEDTSTMEDTDAALRSGVLDQLYLMDDEVMIRNTQFHIDACLAR